MRRIHYRKGFNYPALVGILTVILILWGASLCIYRYERNKEFFRTQDNYSGCYRNMCKIDEALKAYARDHKGNYPGRLEELVPGYLEEIPSCPQAVRDTYSDSYGAVGAPAMYFFACSGHNHEGPADTPQMVSDLRFFPDRHTNPMTYVYENGNMDRIIRLTSQARRLTEAKNYQAAGETLEELLALQTMERERLHTWKALCLLNRRKTSEGLAELRESLKSGFHLEDWKPLFPFLDNSTARLELEKPFKDYFHSHREDWAARMFYFSLYDGKWDDREMQRGYSEALGILQSTNGIYECELFFKGRLLMLSGNYSDANAYFHTILSLTPTDDPLEQYIWEQTYRQIETIRTRTASALQ